nr:putative ribonuclease H-like domain-containing protein [Tanacetum cinerariifolium]
MFTDTECHVLGKYFKLVDDKHVLLRPPRQQNMYTIDLKIIELKFNLFSISQMCDKKNNVLFTDTECLVLSPEFKLPDENQATLDESNIWHRSLGHINFKTMNKLVQGNLVRGLPTKVFKNDHTCVACKKGKQHRASCNTKPVSSVNQPLQRLHMDLFGPTFVKILNKKNYCLAVTDDYSRFTWVFFLATKDETSPILKTFITGIENKLSLKVKIIRSENGTELKNNDLNQFCGIKRIKREFSVPKTPQQNGIAKRKNKTLIEAPRTMLADSLLPIPFWAKVNFTNNTNTFSDVGPSNTAVSLTHRKSSYVNTSQLPDDPTTPELEDITYSDDEEDVGADADFTNLETSITVKENPKKDRIESKPDKNGKRGEGEKIRSSYSR